MTIKGLVKEVLFSYHWFKTLHIQHTNSCVIYRLSILFVRITDKKLVMNYLLYEKLNKIMTILK